jgi:DNA mismatch endonuclease (patch repair protein)
VTTHPRWKDTRPPDEAWRPPTGWSRAERIAEQDTAAGGQAARQIRLPGGRRAHASVALRVNPKGRRIYAYLRWSVSGKTHERYVGEVDNSDRLTNLAQAWRAARAAGLLDTETPTQG